MTGFSAIITKRAAEAAQRNPCVALAAKEAYRIVVSQIWKQKGQEGQKGQKNLFVSFALLAFFASF